MSIEEFCALVERQGYIVTEVNDFDYLAQPRRAWHIVVKTVGPRDGQQWWGASAVKRLKASRLLAKTLADQTNIRGDDGQPVKPEDIE